MPGCRGPQQQPLPATQCARPSPCAAPLCCGAPHLPARLRRLPTLLLGLHRRLQLLHIPAAQTIWRVGEAAGGMGAAPAGGPPRCCCATRAAPTPTPSSLLDLRALVLPLHARHERCGVRQAAQGCTGGLPARRQRAAQPAGAPWRRRLPRPPPLLLLAANSSCAAFTLRPKVLSSTTFFLASTLALSAAFAPLFLGGMVVAAGDGLPGALATACTSGRAASCRCPAGEACRWVPRHAFHGDRQWQCFVSSYLELKGRFQY